MHNIGISFRLFRCLFHSYFAPSVFFIASPTFVPNHMTSVAIYIFTLYPALLKETATLPLATIFATMLHKLMPLNPVVLVPAARAPVLCVGFFNSRLSRFASFPVFFHHSCISHLILYWHWQTSSCCPVESHADLDNGRTDVISNFFYNRAQI